MTAVILCAHSDAAGEREVAAAAALNPDLGNAAPGESQEDRPRGRRVVFEAACTGINT